MTEDLGDFNVAARKPGHGPLAFDPAEYLASIEHLPLSEEEKIEFLRTLWHIMAAFVNWGFGVDSVLPLLLEKSFENGGHTLQEPIPTHEFNVAANKISAEKEGPS